MKGHSHLATFKLHDVYEINFLKPTLLTNVILRLKDA